MRTSLHVRIVAFGIVLGAVSASCLHADDWPTFRHDASRTGVSSESMAAPLNLQWTHKPTHAPRPAWPEPGKEMHRMPFDYAYQVAASGGMVYYGSSADHKLHALDAESGQERWSFFTDAPIRFSPLVVDDRVLVASDDGCVYCLSATEGELLWKLRGGPRDERVVGNGRVISRWPIRTGVIAEDGIAYFAAGMWPAEGVYVCAVRVADGSIVWRNDSSGNLYIKLPHPTAEGFSGVAPQGHLALHGDTLIVPTGRSVPAGYDRETGNLLHYKPGWPTGQLRQGGSWISAGGGMVFAGRHPGGPDTDLRPGEAQPANGEGLMAWDCRSGEARVNLTGTHRLAIGESAIYGSGSGSVTAYRRADLLGRKKPADCTLWSAPHGRAYSLIATSDAVFAGGADTVMSFDAESGKTIWQAETPGQTRGLAVADGRLFVSTSTGEILCFAAQPVADAATITPEVAAAPPDDASARLAQKVLAETGVTEGYCVVLGDGDGSLTSELVSRTDLEVLCAQPVTEQVAATRDALDKAGIYGTRATAHTFETEGLPYPEYFASLVVVGPGFQGDVGDAAGELYRILRPYGGVAYIANTTGSAEAFRSAGAPDAELATGDALVVTRGELPGAGGWTHQYADGGRSGCSSDTLVKWPLQLLWFGGPGPARMMSRHWRAPAPVATHGRMFISGQHSIIAVDAYTGRELWSTDLLGVARRAVYIGGGNVAVDSDSVYTALGGVFLRLDAETGQIRQTYGLPTESPRFALDEPKTFELEIDDEKSGTIALEATAEALRITLTTVDDTVTNKHVGEGPAPEESWQRYYERLFTRDGKVLTPAIGDSWELFFDVRPAAERGGLYGAGAFQFMVVPPSVEDESPTLVAAIGLSHPQATLVGTVTDDGSQAVLTVPWSELAALAGGKATEFAFGATLNSSDDGEALANRTFKFSNPDSYRLTNGLATFVLDPGAPVEPLADAPLPAELAASHVWGYPVVLDDTVLGSAATVPSPKEVKYWSNIGTPVESDYLFALEKADGTLRWLYEAEGTIPHVAIAATEDRVFVVDRTSQVQLDLMKRRGEPATSKKVLRALDLSTGEVVWETEDALEGRAPLYAAGGTVVAGGNPGLTAYSASDGATLWTRAVGNRGNIVIANDVVYAEPYAFDLASGEPLSREHPLTGESVGWSFARAYGCGGVSASPNLLFFRSGTLGFGDLAGDTGTHNFGGVRVGCHVNIIAASGLALIPESASACTCGYNYHTSLALAPARQRADDWSVFSVPTSAGTRIRQLRLNLGASGDRRDADGNMWLGAPRPIYTGAVPVAMLTEYPHDTGIFRAAERETQIDDGLWIYRSGFRGLRAADIDLTVARPVIAPACEVAPTIDGELDDECWDKAHPLPLADESRNRDTRVSGFLRSDEESLYLAFECLAATADGQPVAWTETTAGDDAAVWADDSWQVFITDKARKSYLRLGVAASGARYDANCNYGRPPVDVAWGEAWESAVSATPEAFRMEIAVPWETLTAADLDPETVRLNILGTNRTGVGPAQIMLQYPGNRDFDRCEYFATVSRDEPLPDDARAYTVRLHFLSPEAGGAGPVDIALQGQTVLEGLDVAAEAGGAGLPLTKELTGIQATDGVRIELQPGAAATARPILAAIEVYEE